MPRPPVPRLTVALLFGGRSSEHTISCATAGGVLSAIDRSRYDVIPIGNDRGSRAFRALGADAQVGMSSEGGTTVTFVVGGRSLDYKPDPDFDFDELGLQLEAGLRF